MKNYGISCLMTRQTLGLNSIFRGKITKPLFMRDLGGDLGASGLFLASNETAFMPHYWDTQAVV